MTVSRRDFLKMLGVVGVAGAGLVSAGPLVKYIMPPIPKPNPYPRTKLVWSDGSPVKASELEVNALYLFHYPMLNKTPNFLIALGDENGNPVEIPPAEIPIVMDPLEEPPAIFQIQGNKVEIGEIKGRGGTFRFPGGTGPNKNIVAYSAVCQHFSCQYPALNFFPPGAAVPNARGAVLERGGVIYCVCHGSAYDPYRAAAVLLAPAPRPLPAVVLEWDPQTDELYATELVGPTVTGLFCNTCGAPEEMVGETTVVNEVKTLR